MVEKTETGGWWPSLYEPFRSFGQRLAEWFAPASEASRTDDAYVVKLELPGVDAEDVDIQIQDGILTVKGEKKTSREEKGEDYFFSERQYGFFSRSFRLPEDADLDKIDADMKDGVLTITIARRSAEEEGGPKRVKIRKAG